MSDEANYADILDQSWDNIPETQTLPTGSWKLKLNSAKFMPETEKASARVLFVYKAIEPMDDVNEEALLKLEKDGNKYDYGQNRIFVTFWVSDGADWQNVRKQLQKHGDDVLAGKTITESFVAARGREVIAYLDQRNYKNNAGEDVVENTASQFVSVTA